MVPPDRERGGASAFAPEWAAADWSQYYGPARTNVSSEKGWKSESSAGGQKELWKRNVVPGDEVNQSSNHEKSPRADASASEGLDTRSFTGRWRAIFSGRKWTNFERSSRAICPKARRGGRG